MNITWTSLQPGSVVVVIAHKSNTSWIYTVIDVDHFTNLPNGNPDMVRFTVSPHGVGDLIANYFTLTSKMESVVYNSAEPGPGSLPLAEGIWKYRTLDNTVEITLYV